MNLKHDTLSEIETVEEAIHKAVEGLRKGDDDGLNAFAWGVGCAVGRLRKLADEVFAPEEQLRLGGRGQTEERLH